MTEHTGKIVKLDRGFPLVRLPDGSELRCEHATALVKGARMRAAIGDEVIVSLPEGHDKGIIEKIRPRKTQFVRRDPAERTAGQVLAANFDLVMVAEPICDLNWKRLERELVLAHDTGARVAVVLTKTDLVRDDELVTATIADAAGLAGKTVPVLGTAISRDDSIERVRTLIGQDEVAILIGKSGVGKSSLVNALVGEDVQDTASVRDRDGKGRHTTVDRIMVRLPGGGYIVDMPGVRGLGLWDADQGLENAFADIALLARECRFRDCTHHNEPGCAVRLGVESGMLTQVRLDSYHSLAAEIAQVQTRRQEARRLRGEKASDRKKKH